MEKSEEVPMNVSDVALAADAEVDFTGFQVKVGGMTLDIRIALKCDELGDTLDVMLCSKDLTENGEVVVWLGDSGGFHDIGSYTKGTVWFSSDEEGKDIGVSTLAEL